MGWDADVNNFWMLLSWNAEVAIPSRTTTIAAAANFPTPATIAAATSNTAAVAVTTAVTVAAIRAASPTGASNVDIAATPTSPQKRRARH
jgi:hypothetical protein